MKSGATPTDCHGTSCALSLEAAEEPTTTAMGPAWAAAGGNESPDAVGLRMGRGKRIPRSVSSPLRIRLQMPTLRVPRGFSAGAEQPSSAVRIYSRIWGKKPGRWKNHAAPDSSQQKFTSGPSCATSMLINYCCAEPGAGWPSCEESLSALSDPCTVLASSARVDGSVSVNQAGQLRSPGEKAGLSSAPSCSAAARSSPGQLRPPLR